MVNIGAVMTPFPKGVDDPTYFSQVKLPLLQRMNPDTVRVSQNWGNEGPVFTNEQLQQIVDSVTTEIIIQSSERPYPDEALAQLQAVLPIIQANRNKYFVFEIGNESNEALGGVPLDPIEAGQRFTAAYRACQREIGDHFDREPNLWYAINQPSGKADANYFTLFNDQGVGEAEIATVHIYAPDSAPTVMCPHPEWEEVNPWKIYDWVRGRYGTGKIVKVTEAGMPEKRQDVDPFSGNYGSMRGFDYLEFARRLEQTGDNTDSVCFYGIPETGAEEAFYNLDESDMNQLATRWASGYCP